MSENLFVIEDGIAIPPRTIPNAGPRDSKYPVDQLKVGQGFAIALGTFDEAGAFTPFATGSEEAEKQARQKQSQMSGLAANRKISLVTRYYSGAEGSESPFASVKAPCLGVWHGGAAKPKAVKKPATDATDAAPTDTTDATNATAGTPAAEAPAPAAPAADDTIVL